MVGLLSDSKLDLGRSSPNTKNGVTFYITTSTCEGADGAKQALSGRLRDKRAQAFHNAAAAHPSIENGANLYYPWATTQL
jgi:hypothetical protein